MDRKKKSQGSITHMRQNRLQNQGHKSNPEGHFIILKGRIHQEDINIINIYEPNIEALGYIRKILEDFKTDIDSNIITGGDFNTPLPRQKWIDVPNKISTKILRHRTMS